MRRAILTAATLLLAGPSSTAILAADLTCSCQRATVCGADECADMPFDMCSVTTIGLSIDTPFIRLCSSSSCLEGAAERTDISEAAVALEGNYLPQGGKDSAPVHLLSLYDKETGIGVIQTSDEQAVIQFAMICQAAD